VGSGAGTAFFFLAELAIVTNIRYGNAGTVFQTEMCKTVKKDFSFPPFVQCPYKVLLP
jgi:hypothetical protein